MGIVLMEDLLAERQDDDFSNWKFRGERLSKGEIVIFDVDGVLSDASARQHFLKRRDPDWDGFFNACNQDPLIDAASKILSVIDSKYPIALMTGRPLSVQEKTLKWLDDHEIRWDLLIMRNYSDYSAARSFKKFETSRLRSCDLVPVLAFEDDQRNVEMFRQEKVPCVYLHSGYY